MNRPLTTVERLQQQQSFPPHTTTSSLKRAPVYPLTDISVNADIHELQGHYNDAYPRKRHNSLPRRGGSENDGSAESWRARSTEAYPSPSVVGISSQVRIKCRLETSVSRVVTEVVWYSCLCLIDWSVIRDGNFQKRWSAYERKGVTSLYEWQNECLSLPGVLSEQKNVIYTGIIYFKFLTL